MRIILQNDREKLAFSNIFFNLVFYKKFKYLKFKTKPMKNLFYAIIALVTCSVLRHK